MYTLVISSAAGCRKLLVRNLTIRGYLAVGVSSVREGQELVARNKPRLIILCEVADIPDSELAEVRAEPGLASVPILVVSAEVPSPRLLEEWDVASYLPSGAGLPELIHLMEPWLPAPAAQ